MMVLFCEHKRRQRHRLKYCDLLSIWPTNQ